MYPLNMGIFGAAFATGLAPVIGLSISSIHILKKNHKFYLVKTRLSFQTVFDISGLGSAAFVNEFSSGIVLVIFNLLLLSFAGNLGVAAYGIIANLALVTVAIFTGFRKGYNR